MVSAGPTSLDDQASFADFLTSLLETEQAARTERIRQTLLKLATLPAVKTIESYDFAFVTRALKQQIQELASLTFIERAENVVAAGTFRRRQEPSGNGAELSSRDGRHQDALHHCCRSDDPARRRQGAWVD